jgi:hypothetical protein
MADVKAWTNDKMPSRWSAQLADPKWIRSSPPTGIGISDAKFVQEYWKALGFIRRDSSDLIEQEQSLALTTPMGTDASKPADFQWWAVARRLVRSPRWRRAPGRLSR